MADVLTRCVPKTGHIQRPYVAISVRRPLDPYIMSIHFDCQCQAELNGFQMCDDRTPFIPTHGIWLLDAHVFPRGSNYVTEKQFLLDFNSYRRCRAVQKRKLGVSPPELDGFVPCTERESRRRGVPNQ